MIHCTSRCILDRLDLVQETTWNEGAIQAGPLADRLDLEKRSPIRPPSPFCRGGARFPPAASWALDLTPTLL